jgi:dihydroneopterin aldolase
MIKQLDMDYETYIVLGNNDFEQQKKRKIIINVSLRFLKKNNACRSDDINDTICYSQLIDFINQKLQNAKFNLIEKAVKFLYDEITEYLNDETILKSIKITKPDPPVENLKSAAFICSEW